jgi:hypothetical protein
MFSVFGWAKISCSTKEIDQLEDKKVLEKLEALIEKYNIDGLIEIRLYKSLNGSLNALSIVGLRNHLYEKIIDLYRWLAENAPGSYGLLYIHDDESNFDNEFRILRLARGKLSEESDPFLSPVIPTVEDLLES